MSYQYSNAPPAPGGYPGQPFYGNQPPQGPPGMPNGMPPQGRAPTGTPMNPPFSKAGPIQNGAQGDMNASRGMPPPPQMYPGGPALANGMPSQNLSGPMGAMTLNGPPQRAGMSPITSAAPQPSQHNQPPPVSSQYAPPTSTPMRPTGPTQGGPSYGNVPPPSRGSNYNSPLPPSSMSGGSMPPASVPSSMPPNMGMGSTFPPSGVMPPPPSGPPTSAQQPLGMMPPPASNAMPTYGAPPQGSAANMPPPPGSQPAVSNAYGTMPPQPVSSMPPPGPSGMPPPPVQGSMPPPLGQGGMPPPPGPPGGMSQPTIPGGMPPLPGQGGMQPPPGQGGMPTHAQGGMPPSHMSGGMPPPPGQGGMGGMPGGVAGMPPTSAQGMMQPPPSPGAQYGGQYGGPGAPAPPGQPMSQPAPKKLDPDQMPSPIQVIEDDRQNRSGEFITGERGAVPPLVTTDFVVRDMGNASPRFLRSTMYNVPQAGDMLKTSHLPFAMTLSPFAQLAEGEQPPPIVDLGQLGPIRCNRCKAYMCPFMQFIDGGRRFQCAFCNCATEVPPEYFQHLDHTGRRVDAYQRPELSLGTYEFVATVDYCKDSKLPKPPAFIFMIDVSYNSVKSGLVHLMCERLKNDILVNLPKDIGASESEIRVGFVTYHRELHFYNVKGSLAQPQMMVVSDVEDVFVPLLDGFLVKLSESEAVIDSLLTQIPQMFADVRETEIVLGPVIQAGLDALKSAECAGKLLIFHSSLPVAEAPGKLKNRDDRKLLGTDKEKTILTPQSPFYTKLGQDCVAAGCSVDLFLFPNSYMDIATISEVPRLTGGSIFKYQYFQSDIDGDRFMEDLRLNVMKPIAFDAILRLRTSTGIRPVDFFGNFYMSNTTDVEMATIDSDKAVTIEIKHDDKLNEADGACAQCAVLYTSCSGQRRLRIINSSFNVCSKMADLFRSCELDTIINYLAKSAMRMTLNGNPKQVRESLMNSCAQMLACYRQQCASPSSAGQLILPECMKLLPVYVNCVIKSAMLQGGGDSATDERSTLMFLANAMPVAKSQVFFYPRLMPLHKQDYEELPYAIRCSYERLEDRGVYLIENGLTIIVWIGLNVNQDWIQQVFAVHSAAQIDIDMTHLQDLDNDTSREVRRIVKHVRDQRQRHMKLIIVRQRDKLEPLFLQYLVEDRSINGTASYVDFLCHIHKEIRNLLS